ncbi:MAG: fasciclin domain-containing protein [bacterium]
MKTFRKFLTVTALLLSGVVFLSSCNKDDDPEPENPNEMPKSIVEIASGNEDFSILVDALVKADLVSALEGDGPFTVFAPTNDAFTALFETLNVNGIDDLSAEALRPIP